MGPPVKEDIQINPMIIQTINWALLPCRGTFKISLLCITGVCIALVGITGVCIFGVSNFTGNWMPDKEEPHFGHLWL